MSKKQKQKQKAMDIAFPVIYKPPQKVVTAQDYALPITLGNPPEDVSKALDNCFAPMTSLINHALRDLGTEGMPAFPGYGMLTGLSQNSLIRAGVEMRTNEMMRKWGEFVRKGGEQTDGDKIIEQINNDIEKFNIKAKLRNCLSTSGYMGGCLGFIDFGQEVKDLATPLILDVNNLNPGSFKGIRVIEPFLVTPGQYNSVNPLQRDYFKPEVWYIQGIPVHSSRLLYFSENDLVTLLKPAYNFFGISLAQRVLDAVAHFTSCREAASRLLKKYSLTMFKTDMTQVLTGGFDDTLQKRIAYFVQNRDSDGVAVVDKESEDIVIMTTSLTGVTDVVRQAMEYVAAMFNEPVTKMWGLSPNGFNTGDSDMQNHYDNIASLQERMLGDSVKKISAVLQFNAFGEVDENIVFQFTPLDDEDESATVTNNKTEAERLTILCDAGIIGPEEARQRLIDDPDSGFNNLDPYTMPELPPDVEREDVTVL